MTPKRLVNGMVPINYGLTAKKQKNDLLVLIHHLEAARAFPFLLASSALKNPAGEPNSSLIHFLASDASDAWACFQAQDHTRPIRSDAGKTMGI